MPCKDLIAYELKPIKTSDSIDDAIGIMEDQNVEHLPIVDEHHLYQGMVSYEILTETQVASISDLMQQHQLLKAAINEKAFAYRAAKIIYENNLDTLAIVNDNDELLGITNKTQLLNFMVEQSGILQSGGIIILMVKSFNYSLSEIARICETNDVLILNLQIKSIPDEDEMHIILKTNSKDLGPIEAAFQRYEYNVTVIDGDLNANSLVKERYDLLMNYLKL